MERLTIDELKMLETMIRNHFETIDFEMDWIYNASDKLISIAEKTGLNELASELKVDKVNN